MLQESRRDVEGSNQDRIAGTTRVGTHRPSGTLRTGILGTGTSYCEGRHPLDYPVKVPTVGFVARVVDEL